MQKRKLKRQGPERKTKPVARHVQQKKTRSVPARVKHIVQRRPHKAPSRSSHVYLMIRTATVKPEPKIRREKITQTKTKSGRITRKNKATIHTKYTYIKVTKKQLTKETLTELLEKKLKQENKRFKKADVNTVSHSAQLVKGRIIDKTRGRMAASAKVGTVIYAPSVAKKTKRGRKKAQTLQTALVSSENILINALDKMLDYGTRGLINVKTARKRHAARERKRKHRKMIDVVQRKKTNRQEKDEEEDE